MHLGLIISGILFTVFMIVFKTNKNIRTNTEFSAVMALMLIVYVIFSLITGIKENLWLMILFALSPFIIGRLATYEKESLFAAIQIGCVLASVVYIAMIGI